LKRTLLLISYFIVITSAFSQDDFLAKQYLNDGDYEKAVVFYEKLVEKNPRRTDFSEGLITCYQQLERYQDAEAFLLKKVQNDAVFPTFLIELGYNYTLQNKAELAQQYYEKAIAKIDDNPNYGYAVGYRFQKYALLDQAIDAYSRAMTIKPELNYDFQLARIYGEKGEIEKMYQSYLSLIKNGKSSRSNVLRNIDDFISQDPSAENNITFRKILLQNAQKQPDLLWNELLSWLFIQQRQFKNAFSQEKAIYKRADASSLDRMENLGHITFEEGDFETSKDIFEYILQNANDPGTKLNAALKRIDIDLVNTTPNQLDTIDKKFTKLIKEYGNAPQTQPLQVAYANFLTFKRDNPTPAISLLKKSLKLPLGRFGEAYVKSALGEILVYDQKFNQALIYFTQIQKSLKNDVLGQEARFKVAQTSFYKGDFDWAFTQLKVLRGSTSQLMANDAMQLSLTISDNSLEDSTQTALKKYARADLLAYQKKTTEAITVLDDILKNHKGEKIEDEALLKQAELLQQQKKYDMAAFNYRKIIEFFDNGILADDAYFALGELYKNILDQPEKAMEQYEKIIYQYQDSYYFPQARKNFRILRGDTIN